MTTTDTELRLAKAPTGPLEDFRPPDPYLDWIEREGVKRIVDYAFEDLKDVDLGPWERKGGYGAVINIPNDMLLNDCHLVEIKPGGKSEPEHHIYEVLVYVLSGRGATSIWTEGSPKKNFEWHAGSLFAIPLNAWYQNFNASGTEPARYIAVTNAPPMFRLFGDEGFVFNNPYVFSGRYSGQDDYFSGSGKLYNQRIWVSNFVPNAPHMGLYGWKERGAGGSQVRLELAGNSTKAHISEFPVGTYKKAHRHGPGAHLILLRGTAGFSLLWKEGEEPRMARWKEGAMVVVPDDESIHQHFNSGATPARYLALRPGNNGATAPFTGRPMSDVSMKEGGWQVEYEDEDRKIHEIFEAELAKQGAPCRMKAFIPWCTGEVGPTSERDT